MKTDLRIFVGYLQTKEIKLHLNRSMKWKEAKLLGIALLMETYWQEKEYIGLFIPSLISCLELKKKENEIKTQLQIYCPKINLDQHSIYLFSQLFLN